MFAFALWDNRKKELWLVRDRVGIKPLYYSIHHGRITFASEIKALLEDPNQIRDVHEEAFYHYLSFLTTPAPQTLFKDIKKLPPATWLRVKEDGSVQQQRYWDVWDHTQPLTDVSENDLSTMLIDQLRTAVKYRKVSDVPVGVFLSGGIDSSTNAALFSEGEEQPVKTFCIGYQGQYNSYQNETDFARKMAVHVSAEHHEKLLTIEDLLHFVPHMVWLQDEPIADPVCFPIYYVSKLARDNGVIVCQVGEGADELFYGYPGWKKALQLERLNRLFPFSAPKHVGARLLSRNEKTRHRFSTEWLRRAGEKLPIFWGGAEAFSEIQKKTLISERLKRKFRNYSSFEAIRPLHDTFHQKAWDSSDLNWMSYLDLNFRLPELLLMRVDKMSMGVSLEGRVPYLDHKFVEFALSIPASIKAQNGILKYILKRSVRGIIPDELIDRKKQGFGVPIHEWFFERLGTEANNEIKRLCEETDFFDSNAVNNFLNLGRGAQSWYLYNFALWWKHYIKQSDSFEGLHLPSQL
jgi:asparagine synthase (glutamine-hydrolysing)